MNYKPLFKIAIKHPYYDDARCPDARIELHKESEALFRLHRLVQKDLADGIVVLMPVNGDGAPLIPFEQGDRLIFGMSFQGDDFPLFTDTTPGLTTYTNKTPEGALSSSGALSPMSILGSGFFTGKQQREMNVGMFSSIMVTNLSELAPSAAFSLTLPGRSALWVYYVVTDVPAGESTGVLRIVDKDSTPSAVPVVFGAERTRDLVASPDAGDPVAASLAAQYPGLRRFRFVSDALVASSARGRKHLELQVDGVAAQEVLPNPSIRSFSRIAMGDAHADAWYCVIEHVKGSGAVPAV
jgi:hypothetical protein